MTQLLAEKVSSQLKNDIEAGHYVPGQKLPSERSLEQVYSVSRITINRAMAMLNAQGVLERRRGIGSFVSKDFGKVEDVTVSNTLVKFLSQGAKVRGEVYISTGQESMCKELKGYGKDLIVKFFYSQVDYISELLELESNGLFGAVIWHLPSEEGDKILARLKNKGMRFVLIDSYCPDIELDYVITDNYQGGRMMTEYLIGQGHKNIVYITKELEHFTSLENRQLGFIQGLISNGLPITGESIVAVDPDDSDELRSVVRNILGRENRPTAIFASNDTLAFEIYAELKTNGVSVPDDISLAGFDDINLSRHFDVPLTTIAQDFAEIGKNAVKILCNLPESGKYEFSHKINIKPSLVIRKSVAQPASR